MNYYAILEIPNNASDQAIKTAYRRLAMRYHPDKNNSDAAKQTMLLINEAYAVLSDPVKRARYDNPFYTYATQAPTEDPRAKARREYFQNKQAREQRIEEETIKREKLQMEKMRRISFYVLAFACLLIIDFLLPSIDHVEKAMDGWQTRIGNHKGSLTSYVETANFKFEVPSIVHLSYPYSQPDRPSFHIATTPLFKIRSMVTVQIGDEQLHFKGGTTIYSFWLPELLLISCLFVIFRRDYILLNFSMCFLPPFLFFISLIVLITSN